MSNGAFDRLDRAIRLRNAKESLATWQAARRRTDLSAADVEFLDRQIAGAQKWINDVRMEGWW